MVQGKARIIGMGLAVLGASCATGVHDDQSEPPASQVSSGQIIGTNDFVVVKNDGANIPAKYHPLIDAFGAMSVGCTATHVGNGIVLTAGHCFSLGARVDNKSCSGTVAWGLRADKAAYLTSTCTTLLAGEQAEDRDWAIFRVSPVPPVAIEVSLPRAAEDTPLTIFGHPQLRPLEWSKTCTLLGGGSAGTFYHTCDTEPGNSGSTIIDDATLKVIGIHDGASGSQNYGTYLSSTPIAQFVTAGDAGAGDAGTGTDAGNGDAGTTTCSESEAEPNDAYTAANALNGSVCGALDTGSDVDWYTWSVGTTPTRYDIDLATTGDAQLKMWKLVNGSYSVITNATPTSFTNTSNGAGSYVVSVKSASASPQAYTLSLIRP